MYPFRARKGSIIDSNLNLVCLFFRAIAQDIRETRIDNFGEDKNRSGGKYKKLAQESSIESNDNSNQDVRIPLRGLKGGMITFLFSLVYRGFGSRVWL